MNSNFEQKSFSTSELTAGSVALATVALIAFFGLRLDQILSPAAPAKFSTASIQLAGASTGSSAEQPSERSGVTREQQPSGPASGSDNLIAPGSSSTKTPGSLAAYPAVADAEGQVTSVAAAILPSPAPERNPVNRSDAMWIQGRLHDLAYFSGDLEDGWGVASRNALRDFKSMNGLSADDRWDKETEQQLASAQNISANNTFIGGWASDIGQCQHGQGHEAPLIISSRAAKTASGECNFGSLIREAGGRWHVAAMCSVRGNSWNSNIDLKLATPTLTWDRMLERAKETTHNGKFTDIGYTRFADDLVISSERGTARYVRCPKP
jgi:hypothetical protein